MKSKVLEINQPEIGLQGECLDPSSGSSLPSVGYKLIPLSQGKFAIVDSEDYEWLNQWKWSAHKNRNIWLSILCQLLLLQFLVI